MSNARDSILPEGQAPATTTEATRDAEHHDSKHTMPTTSLDATGSEHAWELRAVQAITDVALSHLTLDRLLPDLLHRLCDVLHVDNAAILLTTEDGRDLTLHMAHGPEEAVVGQVRIAIGEGVAGRIAATREPVIVDDLSATAVANPFLRAHLRSLVGVPLVLEDRLLGVLQVSTATPHHFTERDVYILRLVAARVALALDRARLYTEAENARRVAQALNVRLAAVLDAVPSVLALHDVEGRLVSLNTVARALMPALASAGADGDYGASAPTGSPSSARPLGVDDLSAILGLRTPSGEALPREEMPIIRALRGERVTAVEVSRLLSDGQVRDLVVSAAPIYDADGRVDGTVTVSQDVTALRTAEHQAEERASVLLATFEAITDAVIVCDTDHRILQMNSAGRALFPLNHQGKTAHRAPAKGTASQGTTPPGDKFSIDALLEHLRDAEGHHFRPDQLPLARILRGESLTGAHAIDALMPGRRGRSLMLSISGAPVRRADGQIIGLVLVARDVTERRRLEREAAERASQLETVIESMADGIFVYDADGRIARTNAAVRELFAIDTHPEYLARPLTDRVPSVETRDAQGRLVPEEQWPQRRILRGEVLAGEHTADYLLRVLDGREIMVNVSGGPLRATDGQIVGGVLLLRDVTKLRRLERRTHEALDAVLAMAHVLVTPDTPGAMASETPASTASSVPSSVRSAREVATRLAELTRGLLGCQRVGLQVVEPETQLMRPLAVVGLGEDLERQWWAEQEAHPARYGEGIDPALLARLAAGEAFSLDLTQPPYNTLPNPYGIVTILIAPMRIGGAMVGMLTLDYEGEHHAFTRDELALAEVVAQLAALVIERERLQRERAEAQANELALLTINQRMDEFLGMATHDLKTPVAGSKLNAQLAARKVQRLAAQLSGNGETHASATLSGTQVHDLLRTLEHVEQGMERLSRLVERLLDVSRIRTGKLVLHPEVCDVVELVQQCVDEQRILAPERTIRFEAPTNTPLRATVDPERVCQVVTNYLTNAMRYSQEDQPIEVSVERQGMFLRVAVRDYGAGIPPEELEMIWQRFERASSAQQQTGNETGLGLGLFISREIVQQHGGQVSVQSVVDQGSTFAFTLPLVDDLDTEASATQS